METKIIKVEYLQCISIRDEKDGMIMNFTNFEKNSVVEVEVTEYVGFNGYNIQLIKDGLTASFIQTFGAKHIITNIK